MPKTYEEQRSEAYAAQQEANRAKLHADDLRSALQVAICNEQQQFEDMLKDPDFQRWLRDEWAKHKAGGA